MGAETPATEAPKYPRISAQDFAESITNLAQKIIDRDKLDLKLEFNEDDFAIYTHFPVGANNNKSPSKSSFFLGNIFSSFNDTPPDLRVKALNGYARLVLGKFDIPENFEDARPDILAKAYNYYSLVRWQLEAFADHAGNEAPPIREIFGRRLTENVIVVPCYDGAHFMCSLHHDSDDGSKWNVPSSELLEIGIANTIKQAWYAAGMIFDEEKSDSFAFLEQGHYSSSAFLNEMLISKVPVNGDLVIAIPDRDILMWTGSKSEAGLKLMLEKIKERKNNSYSISHIPIRRCADGTWQDWIPDVTPELKKEFEYLAKSQLYDIYNRQQKFLETIHDKTHKKVFVPRVMTYSSKTDSSNMFGIATAIRGSNNWLPKCDQVAFMDMIKAGPMPTFGNTRTCLLDWEDLWLHFGDRLKRVDEPGVEPPRWTFEFPEWEELAKFQNAHSREMNDKIAAGTLESQAP